MGVLRGTVEEKELSGTVVSSARSSLLKMKLLASVGGGGDGGLRVRDGRGQGWGVRLPDGPGLLRQEVRLHVRWGQKWHVRPEGAAGGRLGGSEEGGQACCADEEQRGHLLQERPSNLLLLLLHLQQAQEQALTESQAHGEAGTQEDGQHVLQHLHGRPLTPVPNLTVV